MLREWRPSSARIGGVHGQNCVGIPTAARNLTGFAEATWDSESPLTERLEVALSSGDETLRISGPPALRLEFEAVTNQDSRGGRGFLAVQVIEPGAAIDQPVSLRIDLQYVALEAVEFETNWSCGIG